MGHTPRSTVVHYTTIGVVGLSGIRYVIYTITPIQDYKTHFKLKKIDLVARENSKAASAVCSKQHTKRNKPHTQTPTKSDNHSINNLYRQLDGSRRLRKEAE